jgi:hypothetical protein
VVDDEFEGGGIEAVEGFAAAVGAVFVFSDEGIAEDLEGGGVGVRDRGRAPVDPVVIGIVSGAEVFEGGGVGVGDGRVLVVDGVLVFEDGSALDGLDGGGIDALLDGGAVPDVGFVASETAVEEFEGTGVCILEDDDDELAAADDLVVDAVFVFGVGIREGFEGGSVETFGGFEGTEV